MEGEVNYPALSAQYQGSYAYKTVKDRLPVILTQVIDYLYRDKTQIQETYGEGSLEDIKNVISKLSQLRSEMQTNKVLPALEMQDCDSEQWNRCREELEQPVKWFKSPWLYVECYMYRRIFETLNQTAKLGSLDPFSHKKKQAFDHSLGTVRAVGQHLLLHQDSVSRDVFRELVEVCLWGNRNDLSISAGQTDSQVANVVQDLDQLRPRILVNDTERLWHHLTSRDGEERNVSWVMDNTGLEAMADLCLADYLTRHGLARSIRFHVKRMPWFVSDVTRADVTLMLQWMAADAEASSPLKTLAERWTKYFETQQWTVVADPFWTLPSPYCHMKASDSQLYGQLSSSSLIVFKGDLNYRKLGADLAWPSDVSFECFLQGFRPAPLVALRTLKADLVSGVDAAAAQRLTVCDPDWMVSGHYGVIQFAG